MDYPGPTADDLDNIRALNASFLRVFSGCGLDGYGVLGARRLNEVERTRLSKAPFLLFSFRESEQDTWESIFQAGPQLELAAAGASDGPDSDALKLAALGFLWQLARRNPYAARIASGAPITWCERLAGMTLVALLERTAHRADLVVPRFAGRDTVWRRLLGSGISEAQRLRLASHQSALQMLLTSSRPAANEHLAAAACRFRAPVRTLDPRRQQRGTVGEV